jgi:hypothetical protein
MPSSRGFEQTLSRCTSVATLSPKAFVNLPQSTIYRWAFEQVSQKRGDGGFKAASLDQNEMGGLRFERENGS